MNPRYVFIKAKKYESMASRPTGIYAHATTVTNDEELYADVIARGKAEFFKFKDNNPFELEDEVTVLTPEQFQEQWMGD